MMNPETIDEEIAIPAVILALEDADPSMGWRKKFEDIMRDPIKRLDYEGSLVMYTRRESTLNTQQSGSNPGAPTTLENDYASPAKPMTLIQRLPTEVISSILDILVADEQFGALATTARASKRMYDLVIPKLYDTIYITESNRKKITYGCTMADLRIPDDYLVNAGAGLNRKDIAASYISKIVLETMPSKDLARCCSDVKHVTMTSSRFSENIDRVLHRRNVTWSSMISGPAYEWDKKCCESLIEFLVVLAPKDASSRSLHATILGRLLDSINESTRGLIESRTKPNTITYEICDQSLRDDSWGSIGKAFDLQAVVHFDTRWWTENEIEEQLSGAIDSCFQDTAPDGQVFLSGVPAFLLSQEELSTSLDIKRDALLKLYNDMHEYGRPKWEIFKAKVHLVEPGFRPSADVLARGGRPCTPTPNTEEAP